MFLQGLWTKELFHSDVYHLIAAFLIYSVIGWCVESIYMSFCNKRLTNRGFGRGPYCPIYGFGAVVGYIILSPLKDRYIALYLTGAVLATTFEFLVGLTMRRTTGEIWWDYNQKPFNYKGIICLESTAAWGLYAIIVIQLLNDKVNGWIDRYNARTVIICCCLMIAVVAVDYGIQIYHMKHDDDYSERIARKNGTV